MVFTPQFGDSFLELIRVEYLSKLVVLVNEQLGAGVETLPIMPEIVAALNQADFKPLLLFLLKSDPNYGSMWFQTRTHPHETGRQIFARSKRRIYSELTRGGAALVYVEAIKRRIEATLSVGIGGGTGGGDEAGIEHEELDRIVERCVRRAPTINVGERDGQWQCEQEWKDEGGDGDPQPELEPELEAGRGAGAKVKGERHCNRRIHLPKHFINGYLPTPRSEKKIYEMTRRERAKVLFLNDMIIV